MRCALSHACPSSLAAPPVLAFVCLGHAQGLFYSGTTAMLNLLVVLLSEGQGAITLLFVGMQPETADDLRQLIASIRSLLVRVCNGLTGSWCGSPPPSEFTDHHIGLDDEHFVSSPQQVILHGGGHQWTRGVDPSLVRRAKRGLGSGRASAVPTADHSELACSAANGHANGHVNGHAYGRHDGAAHARWPSHPQAFAMLRQQQQPTAKFVPMRLSSFRRLQDLLPALPTRGAPAPAAADAPSPPASRARENSASVPAASNRRPFLV